MIRPIHILLAAGLMLPMAGTAAATTSSPPNPSTDWTLESTVPPQTQEHPVGYEAAPLTMFDPLTKEEAEDVAFYAQQEGVEYTDMVRRFGASRPFFQLVEALTEQFPDDYAASRLEADGSMWIGWRAQPPKEASTLIAEFERVTLDKMEGVIASTSVGQREDLGFADEDLSAEVERVHRELLADDRFLDVVTGPLDEGTNVVYASLQAPEGSSLVLSSEGIAASLQSRSPYGTEIIVEVTEVDISSDDAIQGGEEQNQCTSGFAVYTFTEYGMSTAGHCRNDISIDGIWLPFRAGHEGTHGDMQWSQVSTANIRDDFFKGNSTHTEVSGTDVSGSSFAGSGAYLCTNGKENHRTCDTVHQTGLCKSGQCNLGIMRTRQRGDGDSGGPIYSGTTAYGLHEGGGWYTGAYRDWFTQVTRLDDGLGVNVLTWQP